MDLCRINEHFYGFCLLLGHPVYTTDYCYTPYILVSLPCGYNGTHRHDITKDIIASQFEQEFEQILKYFIMWGQNGRIYCGIGPGKCCVINLNYNNTLA